MFDLLPGVDVISKELYFALIRRKVVDFVDRNRGVSYGYSLLDLWGALFPSEHALLWHVVREARFFLRGVLSSPLPCTIDRVGTRVCFVSVGQKGMVQSVRR